ncbi:hypothetical protein CkaCkLH20_12642 [Colletotrichum karsti]|uniref:Cytochrome P450 n=1 Tax=Colletotrichum karsti TaxID=1095194 RepID=A0A9P6HSC5_9PEZI|nr:uncharacterized protein CkaCkLH20_12642 [Colletotrichum karsti]KAF9869843.1 hypothetical protein CkaCkLH20_12642 [Colletotrichum karsti]
MLANFFSSVLACTIIAVISRVYFLCTRRRRDFPVVNDYPGDLFRKRAYQDYNDNAKQLIANGFSRYNGPFAILVPGGMKIILPSSLSDWVKTNRNLDHHQLVREEYFAGYPGFEAQQAVHSSDRMMINLLRGKLSQNEAVLPIVNQHIATALYEHWGDSKSWHVIEWNEDTTGIISKAAACVFVGPEKACDPEWQVLIQAYVREYFAAVGELRSWPALLRPIVQWFLPHSTACRAIVPKVRAIMRSVVEKRRQKAEAAAEHGAEPPQYNDFVAWSCSAPTNTLEPGDLQLGLAMAALFTTSELLRQILIDIAQHSELITPLREEITQVLNSSGLGLAGLDSLELLDSVMKESQRLSSAISK